MEAPGRPSTSGQALIMMTLALLAMSGLIGMVVDFGWSYFVRRTAQSAADAAAMASANSLLDAVVNGTLINGVPVSYPTVAVGPAPCTTTFSDFRQSACVYAEQNGFSASQIQVSAGNSSPYPPGIYAKFWVTVQISNTIPQLYSAVLGNPYATVAATATAAISDTPVNDSLIALNRFKDAQPTWQTLPPAGTKPSLVAGSSSSIIIGGGIVVASSDTSAAGYNAGAAPVCPCPANVRGALQGFTGVANSSQNQPDGSTFYDPFHGMGQPPLSSSAFSQSSYYGVPNGVLDQTTVLQCGSGTCPPGVYYATSTSNGVTSPSGAPLTISGNLSFAGSGNFGDYVFYGGLNLAGTSTVSFGPGRYVLAGVSSSITPDVLNISYGANVSGGAGTDAGRVFILTDPNYPGLQQIAPAPGNLASSLVFGQSVISGDSANVMLYGLNPSSTNLPADTNAQSSMLSDFAPTVIWQDQRFSNVAYTTSGNIDTTCGSLEQPCTNTPPATPQLTFGDGTNSSVSSLKGVVYQPRGAWMRLKPHTTVQGPVTLISGTVDIGPNANYSPTPPSRGQTQLRTHRVAVVE